MKQFYVYLHLRPDGSPFYVGKGHDTAWRKRSHEFGRGRNKHHKSIVAKYGLENIVVLVFKKDSEESAFASEKRFIKILRVAGFELANKTDGGEGSSGAIRSPETRAKLSSININKPTMGMLNKKHSTESIKKMSEAQKKIGARRSPEANARHSIAMMGNSHKLGKKESAETCAKKSASRKALLAARKENAQ